VKLDSKKILMGAAGMFSIFLAAVFWFIWKTNEIRKAGAIEAERRATETKMFEVSQEIARVKAKAKQEAELKAMEESEKTKSKPVIIDDPSKPQNVNTMTKEERLAFDIREATKAVLASLKDPGSARFGEFAYATPNNACLTVNAKNSFGGYSGNQEAILTRVSSGWQVLTISGLPKSSCIEINRF
jgi:hypothetical protein